jgi:hypothetical protein
MASMPAATATARSAVDNNSDHSQDILSIVNNVYHSWLLHPPLCVMLYHSLLGG